MMAAIRTILGLVAALAGGLASPAADRAGAFDYYVLALSWTPSWCEREGDARGAPVCGEGAARGFVLHGLWPQHEDGWPEYCATTARDASRAETARMADIMGSAGLAWHQWKKHGRCSGLSAHNYFALSRHAYRSVVRPEVLRRLEETVRIDPDVVEAAFLEANPDLAPEHLVVTCREGLIAEARLCLTRGLEPRPCSGPAARACTRPARFPPMR
jgi:ribonuclease T2